MSTRADARLLDSPLILRDLSRAPIPIVRAEGVYLYDRDGRAYLDAAAGAAVCAVGHGRTEFAELLAEQAQRLAYAHPATFATEEALELARKLVARAPEGLTRVLFCSGGSEATETAIKLARTYHLARGATSKYKVVTRRTSYHGATLGALALSGQVGRRQPFSPMLQAQPMIAPTSCYRCPFGREPSSCDLECADDLETALRNEGSENVAAFIAEPIVGSSAPGRHPPDAYWRRVREICDRHDVLLIADEVISGNGRSGRWWAMQHTGVAPDLITTAKGLGAGYTPIGAVLVSERVFAALRSHGTNFRHGHTYAGNPLSCAIGSRVIDVIEREGLLANAKRQGERLLARLEAVFADHPHVGRVRGRGLLLGVEFVEDRATKRPFPAESGMRSRVARACLERGLYVYPGGGNVDGVRGDHVLLAPPLTIDETHVETIAGTLREALDAAAAGVAA